MPCEQIPQLEWHTVLVLFVEGGIHVCPLVLTLGLLPQLYALVHVCHLLAVLDLLSCYLMTVGLLVQYFCHVH